MSSDENSDIRLTYLDRDYDDLVEDLKELIPNLTEDWTDFSDGDVGMVLLKLMAAIKDMQAFQLDKAQLEVYLDTATQRANVQSILDLLDYTLSSYKAASVWVEPDSYVELSFGDTFFVDIDDERYYFVYLGETREEDSVVQYKLYQGIVRSWHSSGSVYGSTDAAGNIIQYSDTEFVIAKSNVKVAIDGTSWIEVSGEIDSEFEEHEDFLEALSQYYGTEDTVKWYRLKVNRDESVSVEFLDMTTIGYLSDVYIYFLDTEGYAGSVREGVLLTDSTESYEVEVVEEYVGEDPEDISSAKEEALLESKTGFSLVSESDYISKIRSYCRSELDYNQVAVTVYDYEKMEQFYEKYEIEVDYPDLGVVDCFAICGKTSRYNNEFSGSGLGYDSTVYFLSSSQVEDLKEYLEIYRMMGIKINYLDSSEINIYRLYLLIYATDMGDLTEEDVASYFGEKYSIDSDNFGIGVTLDGLYNDLVSLGSITVSLASGGFAFCLTSVSGDSSLVNSYSFPSYTAYRSYVRGSSYGSFWISSVWTNVFSALSDKEVVVTPQSIVLFGGVVFL